MNIFSTNKEYSLKKKAYYIIIISIIVSFFLLFYNESIRKNSITINATVTDIFDSTMSVNVEELNNKVIVIDFKLENIELGNTISFWLYQNNKLITPNGYLKAAICFLPVIFISLILLWFKINSERTVEDLKLVGKKIYLPVQNVVKNKNIIVRRKSPYNVYVTLEINLTKYNLKSNNLFIDNLDRLFKNDQTYQMAVYFKLDHKKRFLVDHNDVLIQNVITNNEGSNKKC